MWHTVPAMSQCRICKNEAPKEAQVCSPECKDALEDLKIQRAWMSIEYGDALVELQGFEQGPYLELYNRWDNVRAEINLLKAGILALSQPLACAEPTPILDGITEPSAQLLEARQREHKEWEQEQNEANAHDVRYGSRKLLRLERRLKKLDRQLSLTEAEHDVLREKKYAREDTIRKLTEQLGD